MKKNLIFLGPPGSGKGTQARTIGQMFDLFYFGSGDLMRREAELGTEMGKKFKKVWEKGKGELVPDDLVEEFVENKISHIDRGVGIVFDGYPRTLKQAQNLEERLEDRGDSLVVYLKVDAKSVAERMKTRKICSNCAKVFYQADKYGITKCDKCDGNLIQRQEDKPEVLQKRIEIYEKQTTPLIEFYEERGILVEIDGEAPIQDVTSDIVEKLHDNRY